MMNETAIHKPPQNYRKCNISQNTTFRKQRSTTNTHCCFGSSWNSVIIGPITTITLELHDTHPGFLCWWVLTVLTSRWTVAPGLILIFCFNSTPKKICFNCCAVRVPLVVVQEGKHAGHSSSISINGEKF